MGVIPLVVYPIVLSCWLVCRERKTIEVNETKASKQDMMVQDINDAVSNFPLISDFDIRLDTSYRYEADIDAYHDQESLALCVVTNNLYVAPWLTTLLIGGYMVVGVSTVKTLGGTVTL